MFLTLGQRCCSFVETSASKLPHEQFLFTFDRRRFCE
jgi:hypothetical protein